MMATTRPNPTRQIRRRDLKQFRQSIESWERHEREARRDGDVELAARRAAHRHGPQLARRGRRSDALTEPLPSSEAKNPRLVKAGGVIVVTTRRGSVTRLRTRSPGAEQEEQIFHANVAAGVEVGGAISLLRAQPPSTQQEE